MITAFPEGTCNSADESPVLRQGKRGKLYLLVEILARRSLVASTSKMVNLARLLPESLLKKLNIEEYIDI